MSDKPELCPTCGKRQYDDPKRGEFEKACSPLRCDAWKLIRKFNHETREWEPIGEPE